MGTRSILSISVTLSFVGLVAMTAAADSDIAGRLERDAQQASNSGRYEEARQLRALASAIRAQDSVTSRQVQAEATQKNFDKAKEMLRIR